TEQPERNDDPEGAFALGTISSSKEFTGLTIDSPEDEDWYTFQPGLDPKSGDLLVIAGLSKTDGLTAEIRDTGDNLLPAFVPTDGTAGAVTIDLSKAHLAAGQTYRLHIKSDQRPTVYTMRFDLLSTPDSAESNNDLGSAHDLDNLAIVSQLTGLSLDTASDV